MSEKRPSKRVTWKPETSASGEQGEPPADTFASPAQDDGATSREQSNDDRLRADKPPHWG